MRMKNPGSAMRKMKMSSTKMEMKMTNTRSVRIMKMMRSKVIMIASVMFMTPVMDMITIIIMMSIRMTSMTSRRMIRREKQGLILLSPELPRSSDLYPVVSCPNIKPLCM